MTPHKLPNNDEILIVPIPEDAYDFEIVAPLGNKMILYKPYPNGAASFPVPSDKRVSILGKFSADNKTVDFETSVDWFKSNCTPKHHGYCEDFCQGGCDEKRDYDEEFSVLLQHLISESKLSSPVYLIILIGGK